MRKPPPEAQQPSDSAPAFRKKRFFGAPSRGLSSDSNWLAVLTVVCPDAGAAGRP